jgi:cystathionine beta-lyase/cystathionine gamma-synthase
MSSRAVAAAVSVCLLANLKSGDHVVAQHTHYTGTLSLFTDTLPKMGITVTQVNQTDTAAFAAALQATTKIIYTESPSNPSMELTDLRAVAALARAHGAISITDSTFASSFNQQPIALGVDIVLHSATKYLNGHADVTAGCIMSSRAHIDKCWEYVRLLGGILHPFEAWCAALLRLLDMFVCLCVPVFVILWLV